MTHALRKFRRRFSCRETARRRSARPRVSASRLATTHVTRRNFFHALTMLFGTADDRMERSCVHSQTTCLLTQICCHAVTRCCIPIYPYGLHNRSVAAAEDFEYQLSLIKGDRKNAFHGCGHSRDVGLGWVEWRCASRRYAGEGAGRRAG
jgi:hypothetical protein